MIAAPNIARSTFWISLEAVGNTGLQLATLIVLARLLGPAEFGLGALAVALVYTLNFLVANFFVDAIIQRDNLEDTHMDTAFWTSIGLTALSIAGCFFSSHFVAAWFSQPEFGPLFRWMSLMLAFSAVRGIFVAGLRRRMEFRKIAVGFLVGRLIGSCTAIAMAFAGMGVWSFVGRELGMFAGSTVAFWLVSDWQPRFRLSLRHGREIGSFALASLVNRTVVTGHSQLFILLVGHLFGTVSLGHFHIASRIPDYLSTLVSTVNYRISLPIFSRNQKDYGALQENIYTSTEISCAISFFIFASLIAFAEETVLIVFGEQWVRVVPMVQLLAMASLVYITVMHVQIALDAVGRPGWHVAVNATELAVTVVGLFALLELGIIAAAYVVLIGQVLSAPVSILVTKRFVGIRFGLLLRRVAWPLITCAMLVALIFAIKSIGVATWSNPVRLAVLAPLAAGFYVGWLWVVTPASVRRVLQTLGELLPRVLASKR